MPISSIAQIILRIFALNWFLTGIIQGGTMIYITQNGTMPWLSVLPSLVYLLAGIFLWIGSPWLSRLLAKGNDKEVSLRGVSEKSLFATAFISLGLYFALKSFAGAISWIHFFAINKSPDYGFHREEAPSYYDLSEQILTLVTGIALILTSQIWASKLSCTLTKNKSEQGADGDAEEAV
jgi:hypothetical protein